MSLSMCGYVCVCVGMYVCLWVCVICVCMCRYVCVFCVCMGLCVYV